MKYIGMAICIIYALYAFNANAQTTKRELVKSCVNEKKIQYINSNKSTVSGRGSVECPAADIVDFPPRERKHDRDYTITIPSGSNRVICPNPEVSYAVHSDNGGGQGNYSVSSDRGILSVPIYCRGAGLTQGRRWYDLTVSAATCPIVDDEMIFQFTLDCSSALK